MIIGGGECVCIMDFNVFVFFLILMLELTPDPSSARVFEICELHCSNQSFRDICVGTGQTWIIA